MKGVLNMDEFDKQLVRKLMAAGFTEVRRVHDCIQVRRPEDYHPYIQLLWFDCLRWLPEQNPDRTDNWIYLEGIRP